MHTVVLSPFVAGWILCKCNESNEKSINFQHLCAVKYYGILVQLISSIIDRNNFLYFWWIKSSSLVKLENEEVKKTHRVCVEENWNVLWFFLSGEEKIFKKLLSVNWNSLEWNSKWGNKYLFSSPEVCSINLPQHLSTLIFIYASAANRRYFNCTRLLYRRCHESTRDDSSLSHHKPSIYEIF